MPLRHEPDVSAGDWLTGPDVELDLGPAELECHVRVLHPLEPGADREDALVNAEGHLPDDLLRDLVEVLARHTTTPDTCFFGLWDGYGALHGGDAATYLLATSIPDSFGRLFRGLRPPKVPPAFGPEVLDGPRLVIGDREHLLFTGPLADAGRWGARSYGVDAGPRGINSPNLMWPADHAWCVATDIDTPWTGVGGTRALADDLLAHARLQVEEVTA